MPLKPKHVIPFILKIAVSAMSWRMGSSFLRGTRLSFLRSHRKIQLGRSKWLLPNIKASYSIGDYDRRAVWLLEDGARRSGNHWRQTQLVDSWTRFGTWRKMVLGSKSNTSWGISVGASGTKFRKCKLYGTYSKLGLWCSWWILFCPTSSYMSTNLVW